MAKFDYEYGGRLGSISAMDTCFLVWKKAKNNDDNIMTRSRCEEENKKKQGRIHDYPSHVRVGRSRAGAGH